MGLISADFGGRRSRRRALRWALLVAAVVVILWLAPALLRLYTDWLWFKHDVHYPGVFGTVLLTKVKLGLVFGGLFFVLLMGNVELARRLARRALWYDEERQLRQRLAEVMEYFADRYLYLALAVFALLVSYAVGVGCAQQWNNYLLFLKGGKFSITDPVFRQDVGFYVFRFPFLRFLWNYAWWTLIAVFLFSAAAHYLDKAIRVLRGIPAFAPHVKAHLSVLLGLLLALKALDYRLDSYGLLFSPRGVTFGASYTDVTAQLLAYNVLFVMALLAAALVLINIRFRGLWLPLAGIGFLAVASLLLAGAYPAVIQRIQVVPNEFGREKPYIANTIKFTRHGFGLETIEERDLNEVKPLTSETIRANTETLENLRLWDYRPLLDTLQQQQALWTAYRFNSVDVDRYWIDGRYRQVMLAARELSTPELPNKGWQNEHIFNTHGYGVVMAPVSDSIQSGLPNLVMKNLPQESSFELTVKRPGIYYGELTNSYVIVGTREQENDYPITSVGASTAAATSAKDESASSMAKTHYSGKGGVPIGSAFARMAAAIRFNDLNLVISNLITKDSRILWGRNIGERAHAIAPFLSFDQDPYIVCAKDGRVYWIHDAYTTSGMFPYSQPYVTMSGRGFNYVRNSVKVVTDAYDGRVQFFVADEHDPIITAYRGIFPHLFRPLSELPSDLRAHIRYPEALFNTQSAMLATYHMTDARAFYNKADKWEIARELAKSVGPATSQGNNAESQGEPMQAYYAIMRLPNAKQPEMALILPFTPQGKPNMVAWLAARSDGEDYGKLLLYNFTKIRQVWGPIQIEASVDQEETISGWITLRNQQGSRVLRGNLLVIPMDTSVLYVEPIYLQASQSRIPELKQVVLAQGDGRVVMEPTLTRALTSLLGEAPPALAILEPAQAFARKPAQIEPSAGMPKPSAATGVKQLAEEAAEQLRDARKRLDQLEETLKKLADKVKQE